MIVLAYGKPGTGKTTFLHDFVRENSKATPGYRWLIVDHADEWTSGAVHWRGAPPPKIEVVEQDSEREPDLSEPGIYVFPGWEGIDVARLAIEWGNAVYVDDEIDLCARRSQVQGIGWDESPLRRIVHQGRHLVNRDGDVTTCHLLGAARRPQSLHTDVSEQADHVAVFRIQGKRTLDRLLGDSHIEEEDWELIRTLPTFHYREWPTGEWKSVSPIGSPEHGPGSAVPPASRARDSEPDEGDNFAIYF